MALLVIGADATSHRAILGQGVAHAESDHRILILCPLGQIGQILAYLHEGIATVEIVTVDDTERLTDDILTHEYGMIGTPRLLPTLGNRKACGERIEALEAQLAGNLVLVLGENLLAELLLEVLTDHPYYLAESCLNGIVDTIVHDGLTIGA